MSLVQLATNTSGLVRSLSFRRRRSSNRGNNEDKPEARSSSPTTSTGTPVDSEDSLQSPCPNFVPEPLSGELHKKHRHHRRVHDWVRRHLEVDDELGAIFVFRSWKEYERRTPSRILPLSELCRVKGQDVRGNGLVGAHFAFERPRGE